MRSLNKVELIGTVGRAPEMKHFSGGSVKATFSMVTNESYKKKGEDEWTEKATWHNIEMWGKRAEWAEKFVVKGTRLYIEGKLETDSWEDDDGNKRYKTFIKVFIPPIFFGGKKNEGDKAPDASPYDEGEGSTPGKLTPAPNRGGEEMPPF